MFSRKMPAAVESDISLKPSTSRTVAEDMACASSVVPAISAQSAPAVMASA